MSESFFEFVERISDHGTYGYCGSRNCPLQSKYTGVACKKGLFYRLATTLNGLPHDIRNAPCITIYHFYKMWEEATSSQPIPIEDDPIIRRIEVDE